MTTFHAGQTMASKRLVWNASTRAQYWAALAGWGLGQMLVDGRWVKALAGFAWAYGSVRLMYAIDGWLERRGAHA